MMEGVKKMVEETGSKSCSSCVYKIGSFCHYNTNMVGTRVSIFRENAVACKHHKESNSHQDMPNETSDI